jgi:hypothetical protein
MSADPFTVIRKWKDFGLSWKYHPAITSSALPIPAGQAIQIPGQNSEFRFSEGVLLRGKVLFDHPTCGIQFKAEPFLDPGQQLTVQNALLLGETVPKTGIFARAPPDTPPGTFALFIDSIFWEQVATFYVFNTDTVVHNLLYANLDMAVLTERPVVTNLDGSLTTLEEAVKCRV